MFLALNIGSSSAIAKSLFPSIFGSAACFTRQCVSLSVCHWSSQWPCACLPISFSFTKGLCLCKSRNIVQRGRDSRIHVFRVSIPEDGHVLRLYKTVLFSEILFGSLGRASMSLGVWLLSFATMSDYVCELGFILNSKSCRIKLPILQSHSSLRWTQTSQLPILRCRACLQLRTT